MSSSIGIVVRAEAVGKVVATIEKVWPSASHSTSLESFGGDLGLPIPGDASGMLNDALVALSVADRGHGVLFSPDNMLAALLQAFIAEQSAAGLSDLISSGALRHTAGGELETVFDEHDVTGWVREFLPAYLAGRFEKRKFVSPKDAVESIPDNARIAILGDWGSALYGAPVCARSIADANPSYDAVVHLGDVYYAGTTWEVMHRFLDAWPKAPGATSWALNSNHEMYSGGAGYFERTLIDARFRHQGSSCFAFQNSNFLFLGLDTAYDDHDVSSTQLDWINRRISRAEGRNIVLLSHHQPFSLFERGGGKLLEKLGAALGASQVFAWYWGHEHRCVLFDYHPTLKVWGRCIGHGGYPAFRDSFGTSPENTNVDGSCWQRVAHPTGPSALVLDGINPYVKECPERYLPNGYLSLTLDGRKIHETVCSPDGSELLSRSIVAAK